MEKASGAKMRSTEGEIRVDAHESLIMLMKESREASWEIRR